MISLDNIREQLRPRWAYALPVVDAIEARAAEDAAYAADLALWLSGEKSTVHLRDNLAAPIRNLPHIIAIGERFNPTTKWDNTWMPLDTAAHLARPTVKTFTNANGVQFTAFSRADLFSHPAFANLEADSSSLPCVWGNDYECNVCTSETVSWADQWSSQCNDHCPNCGAETEPTNSTWLPNCAEEDTDPVYVLWRSLPEAAPTKPDHKRFNCMPHGDDAIRYAMDNFGKFVDEQEPIDAAQQHQIEQDRITAEEYLARIEGEIEKAALLDKRRLGTILAALRFWQRHSYSTTAEWDIAADGGTIAPLTAAEVDDLCEELNQ